MRSLSHALIAIAVISSLCFVSPANADEDRLGDAMKSIAGSKEPVTIIADSLRYDRNTGIYYAKGNVKITQKGSVLTSEEATLNSETGDAEAMGKAHLVSTDNVVFADTIKVNFDTKQGVIEQGSIFVKNGNYHIKGNPLEKVGDQEYIITGGGMTTCNAATPFWYVRGKYMDVRMDKDIYAKDAVFYFENIPVFYMPYAWLPMLQSRSSGFLMPSAGYNTRDGARLIDSYYWAPLDNFDSTLTLDYRSSRGVGVADELRYARSEDSNLRLYGYFMDDRSIDADRYYIAARYRDIFDGSLYSLVDINLSDKNFFRDLTETALERTQRTLDSNVVLSNQWDWGRAYLFGQYTEGLDPTQNNNAIVQRLPEAGFNVVKKQLLDQPMYFSLDSSAAYFYKLIGTTGGRFDAFPSLSCDFNLAGINFEPEVGYRETAYSLGEGTSIIDSESVTGSSISVPNKFDDERGLFGAGVKLQTDLYKLYAFDDGLFEGIRHTLVPTFSYNYVARRGGENFPVFDGIDTYGKRNEMAYSLMNRFVLKYRDGSPTPRIDYLTVKLSQFYDAYGNTDVGTNKGNFSSLYGEINYSSSLRLTLNNDFRYNIDEGLRSIDTDLRYDSKDKTWHVSVGQRYSLNEEQTFMSPSRFDFFTPRTDFVSQFEVAQAQEETTVDFLTMSGGFKVGSHWEFSGKLWYDVHTGGLRETDAKVIYNSQCWGVSVNYINSPLRKEYMVMLDLKGIGNIRL